VQRYLLHLLRERHLARSSVNQYGCAFRFLYGQVLGLDGEAFQIPLAAAPQRLPEILWSSRCRTRSMPWPACIRAGSTTR
jgi:integrase/recombinase XerD